MAATISVDLNARIAKFETEMKKATGTLDRFGNNASRVASGISRTFGALGVGLSVTAFAGLIKGAIDAQDHLNDLSKTTLISVENLSGLSLAAKQSGSDLDGTASAINKLAVNMGKNAEKFAALGITAKDPLKAFGQLADVFNQIEDPQKRAAFAAAALGKSWQDAAPLLSEGSVKVDAMVKKGRELSGVTKESAQRADEFNDRLGELSARAGNFGVEVANPLVKGILNIAKEFDSATTTGEKFKALLANWPASIKDKLGLGKEWEGSTGKLGKNWVGTTGTLGEKPPAKPTKKALADFIGGADGAGKAGTKKDPQGDFVKKLKEEAEALGLSGEALLQYQAKKLNLSGTNKQLADGFIQQITAFKYQEESMKSVTKLFDEQDAAIDNSVVSLKSWIQEQTFEASLIGLTSSQREAAIQLRNLETAGIYKESEAYKTLKQELADASDVNALTRLTQDVDFTKLKQDQADMIVLAKAFTDGIKDANGELMKLSEEQYLDAVSNRLGQVKDSVSEMDEFAKNAIKSIQSSFADFLFDPFKDGLSGMIAGFGQMIQRMIADAIAADIMKRLFGELAGGKGGGVAGDLLGSVAGFFGFADGGIMTSKGSLPLNKYAGGGVANSPQLALFGEGRMNEAFIPLPDGRSVPVTMMGGGSNKTNITVVVQGGQSAPDVRRAAAQGAREALGLMSTSQRYA